MKSLKIGKTEFNLDSVTTKKEFKAAYEKLFPSSWENIYEKLKAAKK